MAAPKSRPADGMRAETLQTVRPIEPQYRGYRFRSRLEARWAVFFDAAGIEWQYEAEGYNVNGTLYLPDFWLPGLKAFVEVKPTKAEAEQAKSTLIALSKATGHRCLVLVDTPRTDNNKVVDIHANDGGVGIGNVWWRQCSFCHRVIFGGRICGCTPGVVKPPVTDNFWGPRVDHALAEGQRARFEHGETGTPRPYSPPRLPSRRIYVAGPVAGLVCYDGGDGEETDDDYGTEHTSNWFLSWREEICGSSKHGHIDPEDGYHAGRLVYAGPLINSYNHGSAEGIVHGDDESGVVQRCAEQVEASDALFAWIDREETVGTVVEIGIAHARRKPIFVAFKNEYLARHFYFVAELAHAAVIAPSAGAAWKLFANWRDANDAAGAQ